MEKHGSDCIACGVCEEKCPFGVLVIVNMEKAARLFGCKGLKGELSRKA